jgi:transcription elongation factor Elf1
MNCPACNQPTTYTESPRQHGRVGRAFVICQKCGAEVQAIIQNGKVKCAWYRGGTHVITLRLSDAEMKRRAKAKKGNTTDREIYLAGLQQKIPVN